MLLIEGAKHTRCPSLMEMHVLFIFILEELIL